APSMATADTLFEHAGRLLPHAKQKQGHLQLDRAEIKFVAPDALLDSAITADLLLVDEAAAIPTSMLEKLLNKFSRIVFATTLHGYEGTGRGFVIRFQKILDKTTPNWRALQMSTPIRWAKDDKLEAFSFESLLLNASPVEDELIIEANSDACEFEHVDRTELLNDEQSLKELFGLMVLAHYRTRPSDLQMMLDREDVSVYVMREQGHIVASAWLVAEGELDDSLSSAVYACNRRIKGHLLPQSLLAHVGIPTAGALSYQRIIRIAVHPAIQHRGIGQRLLSNIEQHLETKQCDLLGASFAVSTELLNFWYQASFVPVKLGLHQDDVSGSKAVMMLKACSSKGQTVFALAHQRLAEQWSYLLSSHLKQVDAELLIAVSQLISTKPVALSELNKQEVNAFAFEQRGFEFSHYSLTLWLREKLSQPQFLQLDGGLQALCLKAILQQQDWTEICAELPYTGKKQAISALRDAVRILLSFESNTLHAGK
ncbi:MAG: tRNA(Met) cytidine acetyltransferase, partial [Gammaproteobacteria bacterium]|nr:tRNA(Met) cytidine acetyltransferase [Gammaproteobacteria bacterium]